MESDTSPRPMDTPIEDPVAPLDDAAGWRALRALFAATADGEIDAHLARAREVARPDLAELYLPVHAQAEAVRRHRDGARPYVLAHLGQSLDGRIATESGEAFFVTGPENHTHMHRLRALFDAVLVGAGTVRQDDPRLTVRRCDGTSPLRVVLDPRRRLDSRHRLFTDGMANTLVVCGADAGDDGAIGQAEIVSVPSTDDGLDLRATLGLLRARGVRRLFIEGGGQTVSAFLRQGLVDRLQITVAPLILGQGRPGLSLPPVQRPADGLRPPVRRIAMGDDMLFDFDLTA